MENESLQMNLYQPDTTVMMSPLPEESDVKSTVDTLTASGAGDMCKKYVILLNSKPKHSPVLCKLLAYGSDLTLM